MKARNKEYLELLKLSFNETKFIDFVKDLLNLDTDDINLDLSDKLITQNQYKEDIKSYKYIAKYNDGLNNIGIFIVNLKSTKARNLQRNFAATLLNSYNLDASIVSFYSDNDTSWRLSFVKKELSFTDKGIKETLTPAKRYSYLVGEHESVHTAQEFLFKLLEVDSRKITLDDIEKVFDVEKVTKKFFEEYKEKYLELKEFLDNNEDFKTESEKCDFTSVEFAKKLMGQIVFLYFLQKKGWLGVQLVPNKLSVQEYNELLDSNDSVSQNLIIKFYELNENDYIVNKKELRESEEQDIINFTNIFIKTKYNFAWGTGKKDFIRSIYTQAKNEHRNFFDDFLEPFFYRGLNEKRDNQYFALFNCKIPFLNGGLFEPLNNYRWSSAHFDIPNDLFSNDNKEGILDFLDLYNFTIDEEEPLEKDVAVDPEMLGKIFENLLDVDDRKSKGAFYTPREIVYYMCQESLANYIVNKVGVKYNEIIEFIKYGDLISQLDWELHLDKKDKLTISETIFNNLLKIDKALIDVKVSDPAVGSGAFPLGILTEIVKIRNNISTYILIQNDLETLDINNLYNTEFGKRDMFDMKLQTIENSIYAVDIEPSAIDITKLRLWLSLIVDYPNDLEPKPLPNLDCKIMQGNSLIDEYKGVPLFSEKILENNLKKYKRNESTLTQVRNITIQTNLFDDENNINKYIETMLELQKEYFISSDSKIKKELKEKIDNIQIGMVEESLKNESKKLAEFKLISKKRQKPWFIWKLEFFDVFKNNGGFDIIIGNPPYIKERDNKKVFEPVKTTRLGKNWYQGKMDYWYFFLHVAMDYINQNGSICFITPRYWLNSAGATKLIDRLKKNMNFVDLVDIGNLKVFDNVVGYHMIALYENKKNDNFTYKKIINNLSDINSNNNTDNIRIIQKNNSEIYSQNNEIILDGKINKFKNVLNLGDICEISQGVVEASDKISKRMYTNNTNDKFEIGMGIFVLNKQELDNLNLNDDEYKCIKKYIDGKDIKKNRIEFSGKYLIYSDSEVKEKIKNGEFPNLKRHLDKMQDYITSSNKPYGIHRFRKKYYFENKKIITPSMFGKPNFVIDENNYYVGMSFNCIIQKDYDYSLEYIAAILNSKFAKDWFYKNGKKRGIGVDIGVDKLRSFPIKIVNSDIQRKIINIEKELIKYYSEENKNCLDEIIYSLYEN